jgi:capsular polysaccharide biosynthesis protein
VEAVLTKEETMNADTKWQALRERWLVVAVCTVLGAIAAVGCSYVVPSRYSATAEAFVTLAPRPAGTDPDTYAASQFILQRMGSYAGLATSPDVLNAVLRQLGLHQSAEELGQHVISANVPDTVLLSVSFDDPNPKTAAELADAVLTQLGQAVESLEASGTPAGVSPVQVTQVAPADVPLVRTGPGRTLYGLVGLLIGLAAGASFAIGRAARDHTPDGGMQPAAGRPASNDHVVQALDSETLELQMVRPTSGKAGRW